MPETWITTTRYGTDFTDAHYAEVAEGLGCHVERISTVASLKATLQRARSADRPYLIDVLIDGEETVWPTTF